MAFNCCIARPDPVHSVTLCTLFCRSALARFKVPKQVVFGELPKTSTGKIQKFVLRAKAHSAAAIE